MNRDNLYPRLAMGTASDGFGIPIGHGLFTTLSERETTLDAAQLREANLTFEEAHRLALANLTRFADESPALSIQVLGQPGNPEHFLLYSDHPLASSCLLLPDLFDHACEELHAAELCACVPQRESLVIFPKGTRRDRERIVGRLREIEADAPYPLSFGVFELTADGVKEIGESD